MIPRDLVPRKGLSAALEEATFPLPRALFTREAWVLEPKPVMTCSTRSGATACRWRNTLG